MSIAGDYMFVVYCWNGGQRDGIANPPVRVYKNTPTSADFIFELRPGPEVNNLNGWVDMPHVLQAFMRSNGEYLIFQEDDGGAKVLMYQWCPSGNCPPISQPPITPPAYGNTSDVLQSPALAQKPWAEAEISKSGTSIRFSSNEPVRSIDIIDVTGRTVRVLAGENGVATWDGRNVRGGITAPGIYVARIRGASGAGYSHIAVTE
jgi:hypothetical protein